MANDDVSLQSDVVDDVKGKGVHFTVNSAGQNREMVVLASFSATVKGVKLHNLGSTRAIRGEEVVLQRDTSNAYDANCVAVRLKRGYLLGHLEARVAAVVGPLMDRVPVMING